MKKIFLITTFILLQNTKLLAYEFSSYKFTGPNSCEESVCIDKEDLKKLVLTQSYSSQDEYERLYQTRKNIMVKLGSILPNFNLGTGIGAINIGTQSYVEGAGSIVSNFLGFLFPSRWFQWKESKMFFQSQRYSYMTLMANQVNTAENIFYSVQREFINLNILKHYIGEIEKIITIVNERDVNGEVPYEEIVKLEVLRNDFLVTKILIENVMNELRPDLIQLLGIDPGSSWDDVGINYVKIPSLSNVKPINTEILYKEALEKSTELKSLKYLAYAAKYARRYRMFAFLDPASGASSSFGFGYLSNMKISSSQKRQINIRKKEMRSKFKMLLMKIENNHNSALELSREALSGKAKVNELISMTLTDFVDTGNLDTSEIIKSIEWMIKFDLYENLAINMYFNSVAKLNRILWKDISKDRILKKAPIKSKYLQRFSDRSLRLENQRINRAIRRGNIKI